MLKIKVDSRRDKAILRANNHIVNNDMVRENIHGRFNRAFALAKANGEFDDIYSTKRKAENEIKKMSLVSYYNEMSQKMTTLSKGEKAVKIELDDLADPDSELIWYATLYNDYRHHRNGGMYYSSYKHYLDKYNVSDEIRKIVKEKIKEVNTEGAISFPAKYRDFIFNLNEIK